MSDSIVGQSRRERIGLGIAQGPAPVLLKQIIEAEQAGVRQLWITQTPVWSDDLAIFAAAFASTSEIKLGTSILPIYPLHPLAMAQQAATVEALGPGRLRLGVGTSHRPYVEGTYGLKMEAPLAYLAEYVEVLRPVLWEGKVDHAGRFFTVKAQPLIAAKIPLLVAALGKDAFHQAGAISDGAISWNCPVSYLLDVALPALREGAAEAGRPVPPLVGHVWVSLSTDLAAVRVGIRKALGRYARLPFYVNMWAAAGYPQVEPGQLSDELADNLVISGDEATVAARLDELLASGIDELLVYGVHVGDPNTELSRLMKFVGGL